VSLCRYVIIALSEIFLIITSLEYAFTKAPKNMRSLVLSVLLFMAALSSAIGQVFVGMLSFVRLEDTFDRQTSRSALSADPLLVWNYGVTAVAVGIAGAVFWVATRKLDQEEDALNDLREGYVNEH
jgi:proton-dependent oligopeptide transporter, POT family